MMLFIIVNSALFISVVLGYLIKEVIYHFANADIPQISYEDYLELKRIAPKKWRYLCGDLQYWVDGNGRERGWELVKMRYFWEQVLMQHKEEEALRKKKENSFNEIWVKDIEEYKKEKENLEKITHITSAPISPNAVTTERLSNKGLGASGSPCYSGISIDDKPPIAEHYALFYETDTGRFYRFDKPAGVWRCTSGDAYERGI